MGRRLREIRKDLKFIRQGEFGAFLGGFPATTISRAERGDNLPGTRLCVALLGKCGLNLNWLFTGEGTKGTGLRGRQKEGVMTESNERGVRSAECGVEKGAERLAADVAAIRNLDAYIGVLREALSHALGAAHIRPPKAGSDLHVALWHLAKAERDAKIELDAIREVGDFSFRNPQSAIRNRSDLAEAAAAVTAESAPAVARARDRAFFYSNPQSAIRNPQFVRPACNVMAEIPPGGRIACGPLRIRRPGIGSDVVIELRGEIHIDAILASAHVLIRTNGRWYPEVQASSADLPLALFGQGDTQREIRPEDV